MMKKGIGLISMKQIAGHFQSGESKWGILDEVARKVPMLAERKLTPFRVLLHAIWTVEGQLVLVSMNNTDHIRINADAARRSSRSRRPTCAAS